MKQGKSHGNMNHVKEREQMSDGNEKQHGNKKNKIGNKQTDKKNEPNKGNNRNPGKSSL